MSRKMSSKKPLHTQYDYKDLTKTEREVFILLTKDFLTPTQARIRRGISRQAIHIHITNLKRKGYLNSSLQDVKQNVKETLCTSQGKRIFRLHGEEWNVKIIWKGEKYKRLINNSNLLNVDGNTIRLFNESLEIYSGHSYLNEDVNVCIRESLDYINRLFTRLESDLGIVIVKDRKLNRKLVKAHIADLDNEIAKDYVVTGDTLKVCTNEDGKLWFIGDFSLNRIEGEYIHPKTHKDDCNTVSKYLNDWRDHKPPVSTDIMKIIKIMVDANAETAAGLASVVMLMKSQVPNQEEKVDDKWQTELMKYTG